MLKKTILLLSLAAMTLQQAPLSFAVPARPGIIRMTDAGGTEIEVMIHGDEYAHIYTTPSGVPLSLGTDGLFRIAGVDAEGALVPDGGVYDGKSTGRRPATSSEIAAALRKASLRTLEQRPRKAPGNVSGFPGLMPAATYPLAGNPKALVILVEYSDVTMSTDNASDYFTRMLNERGFSDYGATGSASDYFFDCSAGKFMPDFDVLGPVRLSQPRKYYGGNVMGVDAHPEQMVIEACRMLDNKIDFSQYDTNGDGIIDNVFLFYAGRGEADGGGSDAVWPHSSNITYYGDYTFDGVKLDYYACTNEWQGGQPDGIGTFVHEFSHVMGLPDLYATDYQGAFTPGRWSVLDEGPYNNNGRTPPAYSAFERSALGWLEPVEIAGALSAALPVVSANVAGVVRTESPEEFFLFEHRRREGWDTFIPGDGMLVWHVDYNASVWGANTVNNNPNHQYVDLVEADGIRSAETRSGDSFPGASGVTSFTSLTSPSFRSWGGRAIDLPITGIREADGLVRFDVSGGAEIPVAPVALEASDIEATSFIARWKDCEGRAMLNVWSEGADGRRISLPGYTNLIIDGSQMRIENLEPSTSYYYNVASYSGLSLSETSGDIVVHTSMAPIAERTVEALPAENCTADAFTARWIPLEGADSYILSVYTKEPGEPQKFTLGFDEGTSALPEGWTSTSNASYSMASMAGNAIPSLRMAGGDVVASGEYADGISRVSFWHRGSATGGDATVALEALCGESWVEIARYAVSTASGGTVTDAADIPEGTVAVRLSVNASKGAVALDDICVYHGSTIENVPFGGFEAFDVGNVDSYVVEGAREGLVYYTVSARAGNELSLPSGEIEVSLPSGIADSAADRASVFVSGLTISVSGCAEKIAVYDILGRLICSGEGSGSFEMPSHGVYVLRIGDNSKKIVL